MNFRTSYLVGLMASALLVFSVTPLVQTAFAAEPLKITGPDGEMRQTNRQYGPTRSSDTFWSIAQKVRPDNSVSIYQVMAAIYDANPHAFSNANFNSLEKGMILLIPSKDLMLAIPKSMAKSRAERDDKGWKKTTQPKVVQTTQTAPTTQAPTSTPARPVTLPITPADTSAAQKPAANEVLTELTAKLEAAEAKNLQLTDELGRAQDQLDLGDSDTDTLKIKIDELNEQVAILEEQLQASKLQGAGLGEEVKSLQEQINALQTAEPEEDTALWRDLMSNPLMLIAAISIPALLVLALLWLFLRRRRDEGAGTDEQTAKETETEHTPAPTPSAEADVTQAPAGEDLEAMAVHLDTEEEDSIDSLMNIDTAELQPEVDMSSDEQVDLASDMFVDTGETPSEEAVEEEGQSLDDLWAEAMGEQDEEEAKAGEDDLDSLLAGFDEEPAKDEPPVEEAPVEESIELSSPDDSNAEIVSADDLDSLLAGFDEPAASSDDVAANLSEDIAAELEQDVTMTAEEDIPGDELVEKQSDEKESEEDLDALLAGFDSPEEDTGDETTDDATDLSSAISAELEGEVDTNQDVSAEDLDALLAGFDEKNDAPSQDSPVEDSPVEDSPAEDALVEESPSEITAEPEPEADLTDAISAELEGEVETSDADSEDDLDSLLAEFDIADTGIAEQLDQPEILDDSLLDPATELSPELEPSGDDALDSLLADLEAVDPKTVKDPVATKAAGSMFSDLKGGKKADDNSLDWESSVDLEEPVIAAASNDELLSPSSDAETKAADSEMSLSGENEEKLTVDEALAALDAEEVSKSPAIAVPEHDLTNFQKDNGFIDIDRLLNEADEDVLDMDQYKELDVDMGELDSLMGNAAMVDVDDEENSVNAKLDLARAYIEIDDNDSAKALLTEVLLDGNDRQKEEADGLITSLD